MLYSSIKIHQLCFYFVLFLLTINPTSYIGDTYYIYIYIYVCYSIPTLMALLDFSMLRILPQDVFVHLCTWQKAQGRDYFSLLTA